MSKPSAHATVELRPVGHKLVRSWPVGTFLENIAVLDDAAFIVSVHNLKQLWRVTTTGESAVLANMPTSPAGIVVVPDGVFVVGGEPGQSPHRLFHVDWNGFVEEWMSIPETTFLNGFTPGRMGYAYTVDSFLGAVIEIDLIGTTSRIVLRDDRLTKASDEPMLPGVNGIKLGARAMFLTNTDRALVLRAELGNDGSVGPLAVAAEHLRGDDLALDENGALYIANHMHNTLTRLVPGGERTAIAGADQGMAGCTACAFSPGDPGGLYVVTTGGIVQPLNGIVQEAKLVRLEVGVRGHSVAFRS